MRNLERLLLVFVLGLVLMSTIKAHAQSSTNYHIKVDVISGGGGTSSSANYALGFSFGQSSVIGLQSSTSYVDDTGYIYPWLKCTPVYGLADFDGDGMNGVAVYHSTSGLWFIEKSSDATSYYVSYGGSSYVPVPGDYDGDGKADIAVYHSASGLWFIKPSSGATDYYVGYGGTGYSPVNLDYLHGYVY